MMSLFLRTNFVNQILVQVSSKSVEKLGSYEHLKNSIWPTVSRHFEYLISLKNFNNYSILIYLYLYTIFVSENLPRK